MDLLSLRAFSAGSAILSAVVIVMLGLFAFAGGRSRTRGAIVFGLFALVWGVQIVVANLANVAETAGEADLLYVAQTALLLPLPFLLVSFVSSQSIRSPSRTVWSALQAGLLAIAVAVIVVMYADMGILYEGSTARGGAFDPDWGPLMAPLVGVPLYASFLIAIIGLRRIEESAPTPRLARRANIISLGLGLYVSYSGGVYLLFFGYAAVQGQVLEDILFTIIFALVSVAVLAIGVRSMLLADPTGRTRRSFRGLVYIVPWLFGVVEGYVILFFLPEIHTIGLWRLGSVAIVVFGLANWRTFDLPQRTVRGTATTAGVTGSMAGGAAAFGLSASIAPLSVSLVVGTVFAAVTVAPLVRFARRLIPYRLQLHGADMSEALYGQKIDSFRAALEASLARGTFPEDQEFLAALKERFGITDDEERLLLHLAHNSVLVPNKDDPDTVYEKLRLLGEGGSGRTWLVRDRIHERLVVLKEPLERWQTEPSLRERVLREARLAAKVRHPNVVRIEEVVEAKSGSPSIVMEHVDGGSLRDLLRDQGVLPWRQAVAIVEDVLGGLEAVHAVGIVHRDIKPSNILLTSEGNAKVSDFGIAIPATSTRTLIDPLEALAGTRAYMAPETVLGRSTGTRQSDVYACAVVLYECLYGTPPVPNAVVFAQKDIPEGLIVAVERGLAADPKDRHPTVRAFADALRRVTGP